MVIDYADTVGVFTHPRAIIKKYKKIRLKFCVCIVVDYMDTRISNFTIEYVLLYSQTKGVKQGYLQFIPQ